MNSEQKQHSRSPEPVNELGMQNMIRKRYCKNWPAVILNLTTRVQTVNTAWATVTRNIARIEGCRVSYYREKEEFVVEVRVGDEAERHAITIRQLAEAEQYVEVLVMDKLKDSKLIAKHIELLDRMPELPG